VLICHALFLSENARSSDNTRTHRAALSFTLESGHDVPRDDDDDDTRDTTRVRRFRAVSWKGGDDGESDEAKQKKRIRPRRFLDADARVDWAVRRRDVRGDGAR
jgi:hypothetical protein